MCLPDRDAEFVMEGCTGWLYIAEELAAAGMKARVADPAEAAALKGKKKRAKTDRADAKHLRMLLVDGRVPDSWIAPGHVDQTRALGRTYLDLRNDHSALTHLGEERRLGDLASSQESPQRSKNARSICQARHRGRSGAHC